MRFTIDECDSHFYMELKPETAEETCKVARLALHHKRVPVDIYTRFALSGEVICGLTFFKKETGSSFIGD
jgi:hypothetical protein